MSILAVNPYIEQLEQKLFPQPHSLTAQLLPAKTMNIRVQFPEDAHLNERNIGNKNKNLFSQNNVVKISNQLDSFSTIGPLIPERFESKDLGQDDLIILSKSYFTNYKQKYPLWKSHIRNSIKIALFFISTINMLNLFIDLVE